MTRLPSRVLVATLGTLAIACQGPPGHDDEASGTSESSTSTSESSGTESDTASASESESGSPSDLPPAERPTLTSPAEAEDLDPAPDVVRVTLRAAPHAFEVGGELVEGWAYEQQVPGPTIRAKRGDTLIVTLDNQLPDPTSIHWHGLHVPFAMDGAVWQGQAPVPPGETFEYTFTLEQAGTYWYHPHVDTHRQVDLGLYGVIVIEDPDDPPADRELVLVLDAWAEHDEREGGGGHLVARPDLDAQRPRHGIDELPDWTVNGLLDPVFPASAGESIRVRVVDVANAGYLELAWPGLRRIAGDQGLLAAPDEHALLVPGDRSEFEWSIAAGFDVALVPWSLLGAPALADATRLFEVVVDAPGDAPAPLPFAFDGAAPSDDPGTTEVLYAFHGDPHTGQWTINGELWPDITMQSVALGQWSVLELRNISQTAHPFHLHGHAFELLSVDGEAPPLRTIEDTLDVAPYSIVRVGLLPDNPGEWMAHCHILPHAEGGMMTMLAVE